MKSNTLVISVALTSSLLLTGCGASMGGLSAGSDSAYLNANRGSQGSLMSKAQSDNYRRQQDITSRELDLETKKRRQSTGAITDGADTVNSVTSAINSITGLFR